MARRVASRRGSPEAVAVPVPGPGFDFNTGKELAERRLGLDLEGCHTSMLVKPSGGKETCFSHGGLVLLLEGTGFHIFWKGSGTGTDALRAVAAEATVRRWSKHDMRYIPLGPAGYSLRTPS